MILVADVVYICFPSPNILIPLTQGCLAAPGLRGGLRASTSLGGGPRLAPAHLAGGRRVGNQLYSWRLMIGHPTTSYINGTKIIKHGFMMIYDPVGMLKQKVSPALRQKQTDLPSRSLRGPPVILPASVPSKQNDIFPVYMMFAGLYYRVNIYP